MLSVLFCPPAAPRLPCGCRRRRCTGFPSASSGPWIASGRSSLPSHGAEAAKFRSFDMQIYFAIPPNTALHGLLEEFFAPYQRYKIFNALVINLLGAF